MLSKRTDLALEAQELWRESAEKTTKLQGVKARKRKRDGYGVTEVEIIDGTGAKALGKPIGTYLTLDLNGFWQRKTDFFERAVETLGAEMKALLPEDGEIMVIGLGNDDMAPDAVGPETLKHLLITRHLRTSMPKQFGGFRSVSACATGVLGTTGVESAEAVRGLVNTVKPDYVIAVDALASRKMARVCTTIQLADTGIVPGSGVGNDRMALNKRTLGVPVLGIGVPTVVDATTLVADLLEGVDLSPGQERQLNSKKHPLMVTHRDIDARVRELSRVIGYGINWALQDLDMDSLTALLG